MKRHAGNRRSVDLGALLRAPFAAFQWRLLLLWTALLLLPTAVVVLPLWRLLAGLLDVSVHAAEWARGFDALMMSDLLFALNGEGRPALDGAALAAFGLLFLLTPLLNGMVVGSALAGRALGFGHLLQSGIVEYGRQFRLSLLALLPWGLCFVLIGIGLDAADDAAGRALRETDARQATLLAQGFGIVLFVIVHAGIESARASFMADSGLRSALRALGRGFRQVLLRPFSTLGAYLLVSLAGYFAALALGVARAGTPAVGGAGFVLAFLLAELAVFVLGWVRVARLYALAEVARALAPARFGAGFARGL